MKRTATIDFTATVSVDVEIEVSDDCDDLSVLDEDDLTPEESARARIQAANQGVDPDDLEVDYIWVLPNKSREE